MLKNKETGDAYFVVVFTLLLKEDVEKQEAKEAKTKSGGNCGGTKSTQKDPEDFQSSVDDLD